MHYINGADVLGKCHFEYINGFNKMTITSKIVILSLHKSNHLKS